MSKYELAEQAIDDLANIREYIAQDSATAASRHIKRLRSNMKAIADAPGIGRSREELSVGLRSFPVGSYVIYYRKIPNGIRVLRVLHGARRVEDLFPASEEPDK